ncbi:MAG: hypothetical protein SO170_00510 [Butyribacter sp.]|nr:hypothetical protein [bacterium]MDY3853435.1 hypothetical protein [Butyribacter sp.]
MGELLLEFLICAVVAVCLMVVHELSKAIVYIGIQRFRGNKRTYQHSIWAVHRYIDPVGVILAVTSSVPFSKPFMFRIQNKKVNRILGITGFLVLFLCFFGSMAALKCHIAGVNGMKTLEGQGMVLKIVTLSIQYCAILSFGMLIANLFPISTFDMGLIIAGFSAEKYLNLIKKDAIIKIIFVITIFFGIIHYGGYRLITFLL